MAIGVVEAGGRPVESTEPPLLVRRIMSFVALLAFYIAVLPFDNLKPGPEG